MDHKGLTVAASNWRSEHSFVGENFGFRPYFQQAMQGHIGRYYALGKTSGLRGYYFAYPVQSDARILGAVVIKINMDSVEKAWGLRAESFVISDPDGVIFLSTNPDWRFKSLQAIDEGARQRIAASLRYPDIHIDSLDFHEKASYAFGRLLTLDSSPERKTPLQPHPRFLQQVRAMPEAGWNVQIFSSTQSVEADVLRTFLVAASGLAFLILSALLFRYRRRVQQERLRYEQRARDQLQRANELLEVRVAERTAELTAANQHLRRTRDELIQSAKLAALGQMAAGINHEINQPLAAIRAYADNGRLLLDRGCLEPARENLLQITELTERMAQIGAQLKIFARKTTGQLSDVRLGAAIDGALKILSPAIRRQNAEIIVKLTQQTLQVRANDVLLQQVLVNLLSNALQAMECSKQCQISVSAKLADRMAVICVEDTGPGVMPEHAPHIFEPFYTTKEAGQGLGLGLSITQRILEEMQGSIRTVSGTQGACFEIRLPAVNQQHE
jgi:two-component system C4-dicarboxylate transport sensor histidine kinase DctB